MESDEKSVFVFTPALAPLLARAEQLNGAELTEAQVLAIKDGTTIMAIPERVASEMEKSRGYRDINPARVWEEWQQLRKSLME